MPGESVMQLGYFGKTIHRGDFVRFNLPKSFFTVMDDWLQGAMETGETTFGGDWPERFHNAAGFRFQLSVNIAGENGWFGIITPSSDKVGRRFPFCLAASLAEGFIPPWGQPAFEEGLRNLEAFSAKVNNPDYTFDSVQEDLAVLAADLSHLMNQSATRSVAGSNENDEEPFLLAATGREVLQSTTGCLAILDSVLKHNYFSYSVWQPIAASDTDKTLITSGLPPKRLAVSLFDGDWSEETPNLLQLAASTLAAPSQ
ncbi:MAG: type VI secretion system-associated protein TagF, partial [Granulosicoccus sp.]|nr:type VI secretion system-associated protein TagF [Granulosicoccus sp.]